MENMYGVLALLFFTGAIATIYWSLFAIKQNRKSSLNKTYIFICLTSAIWSFGFGMSNLAPTIAQAVIWRRMSSVGMVSMFSFVLYFIVLLTTKKESLKFKRYLSLIFIPTVILIYVYAISPSTTNYLYDLVKLNTGITNVSENTIWNYLYYTYYLIYVGFSIILLIKWRGHINNKDKIKQANFIIIGMLTALAISSVTDVILTLTTQVVVPQMAPLFVLIPIWTLYYAVRHHDILNPEALPKPEEIVTKRQEKHLLTVFALGLIAGGILSFIFQYFSINSSNQGKLLAASTRGIVLLIVGMSLFFVQKIKNRGHNESATVIILLLSIPIVVFQFIEFSSITVWVYPIVIIITALLFNKRTLINSVTVVAILTQITIWILKPELTVVVDMFDYVLRILIIVVVFLLGTYLNKVYMNKIKENNYQIEFQKLISDITLGLVGFNKSNAYEKLNNFLASFGEFFNADRAYIFTINNDKGTMNYSNEWCNIGVKSEIGRLEDIPIDTFSWLVEELYNNKMVHVKDVNDMPSNASHEQKELLVQDVKSLVCVPIISDGVMQAFIGMDIVFYNKVWSKETINLLSIVANILSSIITPLQINEETEFRSYNDSLTKLPNRYLFYKKVAHAIDLAKLDNSEFAILFVDLDNFKAVNDATGHIGGDLLLKKIAASLTKVVKGRGVVSRFGGDEFLIMLDKINNMDDVYAIANKVMDVFSSVIAINKQQFLVTASAGIAMYSVDGSDADTLIKNADIAMYKAKDAGKNQYLLCTKEMKDEISLNAILSNDLINALENNEFFINYQPQIDISTNSIVGVEALVRWHHPKQGNIPPGIFIPLAEKSNLINLIGEWVLKTSASQVKAWQDMGLPHIGLSVNLSSVQMINPNLVSNIKNILKTTGLNPKDLRLEITEGTAINETNHVIDILNRLVALGISIAIDDFGVEYSSLNRLKSLPIAQIKIDMEFIRSIEDSEKDRAIIMIIINLAKKLGLNVIAEGVETKAQLDFLIKEECQFVQGYYFYKPQSTTDMEKILIARNNK